MTNPIDFRADQIQTNKLIVKGGNAGSTNALLIYGSGAQDTPLNEGNIKTTVFPQTAIGSDVFVYVSGAVGARNTTEPAVSVFGGDVHISGNLSIEGTNFNQLSFVSDNNFNPVSLVYGFDHGKPVVILSASSLPDTNTTNHQGTDIILKSADGRARYIPASNFYVTNNAGSLKFMTGIGADCDINRAGNGGDFYFRSGNGGSRILESVVGSTASVGNGGGFSVYLGNGGNTQDNNNNGGLGGGGSITCGNGGDCLVGDPDIPDNPNRLNGGFGGSFGIYAGAGGYTYTGEGGTGGSLSFLCNGGGPSFDPTGIPGYGGDIALWAGTAGGMLNYSSTPNAGGSIFIYAGASTYVPGDVGHQYKGYGGDIYLAAGTGSVCGTIYIGNGKIAGGNTLRTVVGYLNTGSLNTDVGCAISGAWGSKNIANSYGVTLIDGDFHVSGNVSISGGLLVEGKNSSGNFPSSKNIFRYYLTGQSTITLKNTDPIGTTYEFWDTTGTAVGSSHTIQTDSAPTILINGGASFKLDRNYGRQVVTRVSDVLWIAGT